MNGQRERTPEWVAWARMVRVAVALLFVLAFVLAVVTDWTYALIFVCGVLAGMVLAATAQAEPDNKGSTDE